MGLIGKPVAAVLVAAAIGACASPPPEITLVSFTETGEFDGHTETTREVDMWLVRRQDRAERLFVRVRGRTVEECVRQSPFASVDDLLEEVFGPRSGPAGRTTWDVRRGIATMRIRVLGPSRFEREVSMIGPSGRVGTVIRDGRAERVTTAPGWSRPCPS